MVELRVFTLDEVMGGDTYEIAYAHSYPDKHWSKESLYFSDDADGMGVLSSYFNDVFPQYAYYGPQKVTIAQWNEIEKRCRADNCGNASVDNFFKVVAQWINEGSRGVDYFWILGI